MQLKAWHRLWVLASVVMFAVFVGVAASSWPDETAVPDSTKLQDKLSVAAKSQIAETASQASSSVRMPNGHLIHLKPGIAASRKTEVLSEYQTAVLERAREMQVELGTKLLTWWAGLCLGLLAFGHLVAWVRAGFAAPPK